MLISEITEGILTEGVQQIWGRNAGKVVKRYRCTTCLLYTSDAADE